MKWLINKLTGFRSRRSYWSTSEFSYWIISRFTNLEIIKWATMEDWNIYKSIFKTKYPVIYWFTKVFLSSLQNIIYFPYDVYLNTRYKFINKFINKTQYLDTKLNGSAYHEIDTRILHGLMETLVTFVEVEKSQMLDIYELEYKYMSNREKGLQYLDWEILLNTKQGETAKSIKELYWWWVYERPTRPKIGYSDRGWFTKEQEYFEEDNKMLIKLISIRQDLWT